MTSKKRFQRDITTNWKAALFFFKNLPSLFFWRARVMEVDDGVCRVKIPYSWRTRNPFRSIYFSAQAGAAEISTGILCKYHMAGRGAWSMYVLSVSGDYTARATTDTIFTCEDGDRLAEVLDRVESSGTPEKIEMVSTGVDASGAQVSRFVLTWSFKKKSK